MSANPTKKAKTDTFDALSKQLVGVINGIKTNLPAGKSIPWQGQSVLPSKFTTDFQAFVDKNASADSAKQTALQEMADRLKLKVSTKQELRAFSQWARLTFGEGAYAMFNLPVPKPRAVSPTKQAIGIAKLQARAKQKAAVKTALAPQQESFVALDASGNAIGAAPAAPAANPPLTVSVGSNGVSLTPPTPVAK